jgi:3',5'-cyclic AMP phosphodiesterase CpdA
MPRTYDRRQVLRAAGVLGVAAPILWRGTSAAAATPAVGPRWITIGTDPATEMHISWSTGSATAASTPPAPQLRFGTTTAYGKIRAASHSTPVPVPAGTTVEPAMRTIYSSALLGGLRPGTKYHYSVSNDGVTWTPDATFTTAPAGSTAFRFTAFGDQASSAAAAGPMVDLVAAQDPAFHLVAGDLAYATPLGEAYPDITGFEPAQWDQYLAMVGPGAAERIPWSASVGAHEVEPLGQNGYAGFVTRFPQSYASDSGTHVNHSFRYGNVAVIHLDGNELSAQETINNGYSRGAQTAWLGAQLAAYRAAGSGVDFVVAVCNCCCYSSNTEHGSDGGLRDVWGPLFDSYSVDLVISGHVHAYERTHPMRAGKRTREALAGATVTPATDGTTYICAGGGGNGLYSGWYGATGSGDAGSATEPKVWTWTGSTTALGGTGKSVNVTDSVTNFSAVRRAVYSCLVIDVTPRSASTGKTTMTVKTLMPAQTATAVTSIASPTVIDSVTLVRT